MPNTSRNLPLSGLAEVLEYLRQIMQSSDLTGRNRSILVQSTYGQNVVSLHNDIYAQYPHIPKLEEAPLRFRAQGIGQVDDAEALSTP